MSLNVIIFDWLRNPSVFVPFNLIFNLKLILNTFLPISRFPCCLLSYVCCLSYVPSIVSRAVCCLLSYVLSFVLSVVFCVVCCLLVLVCQVIYMKYLLTRPRRGYGTKDTTEKNWIRELNTLSKEEEEVVVVITEEEEEEASVVSISRLLAYY